MHFNFLKLHKCACIVCLLLPVSIFAQDYRPGYIIKNNMDSVSGFIEYATEKKNSKYCMFRASRKSKSEKYAPDDLLSYGFFADKLYVSMLIPGSGNESKVFVKVLAKGPLQLYQYRRQFVVRKDSLMLLPTPKSKVVQTSEGMKSKDDSRYKGLLNFLISDCKLSADETKYTEYDLTNLVNNYNRCRGFEPLYKKPKANFKVNYMLFGGYTQSNLEVTVGDHIPFNTSNTVVGGLGVDLSSPRIYDRIFFTLDISYVKNFFQAYMQDQSGNEITHYDLALDVTSIKVPFGLRYNFMKDTNTPYIKAGLMLSFLIKSDVRLNEERQSSGQVITTTKTENVLELQNRPKGIWMSVGYNRKISKSLQIFAELRYDQGEGFIGSTLHRHSDLSNYNFLLGIRF